MFFIIGYKTKREGNHLGIVFLSVNSLTKLSCNLLIPQLNSNLTVSCCVPFQSFTLSVVLGFHIPRLSVKELATCLVDLIQK